MANHIIECWKCKRTQPVYSRGLCQMCFMRFRRRKNDPDAQYELWLRGPIQTQKQVVDADVVEWLLAEAYRVVGNKTRLERVSGVPARRVYEVERGGGRLSVQSGAAIARAIGVLDEFEERACVVGRPGWSDVGSYCGDGSGPYDGCGTYFHPSYRDGLCEECYSREVLGEGPGVARDVRVVNA